MNIFTRSVYLLAYKITRTSVLSKNDSFGAISKHSWFYNTLSKSVCLEFSRDYSKSKDKGKDKKKTTGKIEINTAQLSKFFDIDEVKKEFENILNQTKEDMAAALTVRSSVGAIETIKVPYEGKTYELQEVAQVVRKNPKTVILNMTSLPQVIPSVLKSIETSGLNLNPQQDGTSIFIPIPKVTKEHREGLAKSAKAMFNGRKVDMKQIELKCFRKLKLGENSKGVSEDAVFAVKKQITAICDSYESQLRDFYVAKIKELTKE